MKEIVNIILCIVLIVYVLWILRQCYLFAMHGVGWLVKMGWWFPKTVARTLAENQAKRDIEMAELDKIINSRS